jgi:hypothetical protein
MERPSDQGNPQQEVAHYLGELTTDHGEVAGGHTPLARSEEESQRVHIALHALHPEHARPVVAIEPDRQQRGGVMFRKFLELVGIYN